MPTSKSTRELYSLPKKQLERIERKRNYDKAHSLQSGPVGSGGGGSVSIEVKATGGPFCSEEDARKAAVNVTKQLTEQLNSAGVNANITSSPSSSSKNEAVSFISQSRGGGSYLSSFSGQSEVTMTQLVLQQQQAQLQQLALLTQQKQNELQQAKDEDKAGPADIAALPLLQPFKIPNPNGSTIINTIINEQHAADNVAAMMKQEETLRGELQKAKSGNDEGDDKKNGKDGGNGGVIAKLTKKSKKSAKKAANATQLAKIKEIETNLNNIVVCVTESRNNLTQFANWTKAMLQSQYSKLAVTLDPDSKEYEDLEEAFAFLCPPLNNIDGTEEYYHEQRITYVKEMLPIIKKAGEKNFPASLVALPYIKKFQADEIESPIVSALIDEMYQLVITEAVRVKLEKQLDDKAKFNVLRHAEEMLERREVETTELVRKHYRKRSIKLHPDRNGEHMRPVFEEFTDARTVLSDVKLRQSYLRGMLDVFKLNLGDLNEAHEAWNRKYRPDKAQSDLRTKKDKSGGGGEGKTLKLEGGLHQQIPKGVVLHHRRDGKKNHVVSISIRVLHPLHEFYARVRSVNVVMRDSMNEKHKVTLTREQIVNNIRADRQGPILENEIPVIEKALNPGHWEVFWYAVLDTVGTDPLNIQNATKGESVTTRPSASSTFIVVDYDQLRRAQDFEMAESSCKVIKGELANTLHKLRTNQVDSASLSTPARFGHYHQVLVRARKKCWNLYNLMKATGKPSPVYDSLSALLTESRQVFAELEEKADAAKKRKEKRDDTKRFKAFIASILESDEPVEWMKEVQEAKLYREGGDVNRLYQLFIEGKGKYTLMVDSEMYLAASQRSDIFSAKQCQELATRTKEVAAREDKDAEEERQAEEQRIEQEEKMEKMKKEAELKSKWDMVGQNATIHGLASDKGKSLNGKMGRILYYNTDKDRFEVQLYSSEEKAYLKKANLTVYYGHVPKPKKQQQAQPPKSNIAKPSSVRPATAPVAPKHTTKQTKPVWNCEQCTFENDDASTACSMCTTPRSKVTKQAEPVAVEKKAPTAVQNGPAIKPVTISLSEKKFTKPTNPTVNGSKNAKVKKTIYVRSSHSKKLTGKRGRKKTELIRKSGTDDIQIENSPIGNHIPVHLSGTQQAITKAVALIEETIGKENVSKKSMITTPPKPSPPAPAPAKPPTVVSPPVVKARPSPKPPAVKAPSPRIVAKAPAARPPGMPSPAKKKPPAPITTQQPSPPAPIITQPSPPSFMNSGIFSGFDKPVDNLMQGIQPVSSTSETQQTSQYSFGDALLPKGLMDMSISTPATAVPPEISVGVNSQGMTRETITEASISSLNDRSNASKTGYSSVTLNESDPLLVFLRANQQCIKGSVDDFYIWLVKSEDIDTMMALKEAVADEDYLNDTMKVGNGSSGVKGFKRKAFQRAVEEYEIVTPAEPLMSQTQQPSPIDSISARGLSATSGSAFLPSNLFDPPSPARNDNNPPEELVCPIALVLMTEDPVLAADGVTYERSSIEGWFAKSMTKINNAKENLKWNPCSIADKRILDGGISSPSYGTKMTSLALVPNMNVKIMANDFKEGRY